MFYKSLNVPGNTRQTINTFLGYNHNHQISYGEFYDMKNLTSREYPALSPRNARSCILTLNSSDWQKVDIEYSYKFVGQISEVKAVFETNKVVANAKELIEVAYVVDLDIVSNTQVSVKFYKDENVVSETLSKNTQEQFTVPDNANGYQITITAWPTDVNSFTEDVAESCITNLSVQLYNWNIRGMLLKEGKLAFMVGSKLYYDNEEYDFANLIDAEDDYLSKQQLVSMGSYILVFPLGGYLNTTDLSDFGTLGAEYVAGANETQITYTLSTADGEEINASMEKPDAPENGVYWLDTSEEQHALYRWSESMDMWVSVASTYIKISMEFTRAPEVPFPQMFKEGDALHMNTCMEDINNGSVIVKQGNITDENGVVTDGYIIVKGLLSKQVVEAVSVDNPISFKRKIPKMDYVCVSNNRVWGCYNGVIDEKNVVNEIYASKLGDPKNWYCFQGASTDSYTLSLGDDGEFTGAFTYQGYPMFFKENVVYKIYGAYPAAYQLYTYNCRGVQKGSDRSLAVVNEYLMYKSVQDVCVFDGNTPSGVSQNLGNKKYYEAAAGASLGKYYISMKDEDGNTELFVFDLEKGIWHKEDDLYLEEFAYNNNGALYGRNKLSMYGFENATSVLGQQEEYKEGKVKWMAETGDYGMEVLEKKYAKAIHLRAYMAAGSSIDVYLKEEGKNWKKLQTLIGKGTVETYRIPTLSGRVTCYRVRLEGYGPCRIYSMTHEIEKGSDR